MAEWVRRQIPDSFWNGMYRAIGLIRGNELVGGVVYTDSSKANISMSVAGTYFSRQFIKVCFGYPFLQLRVNRVTGYIASRNMKSRVLAERIGMRLESIMERALPDDDVMVYRMFKEECKWVNPGLLLKQ